MSKKVRVKMAKKIGVDTSSLNDMFEEMTGMKDADPNIIRPKFVKLRNLVKKVYETFNILVKLNIREDYPSLEKPVDEIVQYINKMKESVFFSLEKEDDETKYLEVSKSDMNSLYKTLKENDFVKSLITLCGRLKRFEKDIGNKEELKSGFIGLEPGLDFQIFDFSTLDLKKIWVDNNIRPLVKTVILQILHKIYMITLDIYDVVTSPDVDLDDFINLLLNSIGDLETRPGLHRCKRAFKRIKDSVSMLKENFGKYYRESISCGNPDIIVQNFIIDVSNKGGPDARLTSEFRQIITYMHRLSEQTGKNKDPKVQQLFKMLNKNFELMEKGNKPKKGTLEDIDLGESGTNIEEQEELTVDTPDNETQDVQSNE